MEVVITIFIAMTGLEYKLYPPLQVLQLVPFNWTLVLPLSLGKGKGMPSTMIFPCQVPTPSELNFWEDALHHLTSPKLRWSSTLGKFAHYLYNSTWWGQAIETNELLCISATADSYERYIRQGTDGPSNLALLTQTPSQPSTFL